MTALSAPLVDDGEGRPSRCREPSIREAEVEEIITAGRHGGELPSILSNARRRAALASVDIEPCVLGSTAEIMEIW